MRRRERAKKKPAEIMKYHRNFLYQIVINSDEFLSEQGKATKKESHKRNANVFLL